MTNKIGIGIEASLDASKVEQGLNALGQKIAQANKVQFTPVSVKTIEQVQQITKQFEQLRKVNGDLNKRMKATGQGDATLLGLDWDKLYPDQLSRARQMRKAFEYSVGQGVFQPIQTAPNPPSQPPGQQPPGQQPRPRPPGGGGGIVTNTIQAGLNAAGPVGGVASNALGTGMSAGFGAGLGSLLGGLLALGVGKIVGSVVEKVGEAEQLSIEHDRLKRILGDVGVDFGTLRDQVKAGANSMGLVYSEGLKLTTQFSKLSNAKGEDYTSLQADVGSGVGLSRSFGLDPAAGVGVLGQMRGLGITKDTQDTRRFALLIGETIGKSGAFSKADEVMESIANYAQAQTRASLSSNAQGYAGMFSALAGSGIPGLDPAGAGSMLSRVNSALMAGGAKGEASQFFSALVAQRMGLDPLQAQVFREGGAFATKSGMFGDGSAYSRYMGKAGPGGNTTFLDATRRMIEEAYKGDSDKEKLLRAQAFANHTGLNMNQAMALLSVKPNEMGEMQKFGDLQGFNAGGIASLSKVLYGSDKERKQVADSLLARKDVSKSEKDRISEVMKTGSTEQQRQTLGQVVARHDQEETEGKVARDSKALLDNIKTSLAEKVVPLLSDVRMGIVMMAGGGKMTAGEIADKVAKREAERAKEIAGGQYRTDVAPLEEEQSQLEARLRPLRDTPALQHTYRDRPDILEKKQKERQELEAKLVEVNKRLADAMEKRNAAEKKADEDYAKEKKRIDEYERMRKLENPDDEESKPGQLDYGAQFGGSPGGGAGRGSGDDPRRLDSGSVMPKGMGKLSEDPEFLAQISANERELGAPLGLLRAQIEQESRFHPNAKSPAGAMGLAQVMPSTLATLERRMGRKLDPYDPKDALVIQKEVMRENYERFGNWDDATSAYNGGWDKGRWGNAETSNYTPSIRRRMQRYQREGSPLPSELKDAGTTQPSGEFRVSSEPIVIRHENMAGMQVRPDQEIQTRVRPLWRPTIG